jgi:hypothetical protein
MNHGVCNGALSIDPMPERVNKLPWRRNQSVTSATTG